MQKDDLRRSYDDYVSIMRSGREHVLSYEEWLEYHFVKDHNELTQQIEDMRRKATEEAQDSD